MFSALAILAITNTEGFFITPVSILVNAFLKNIGSNFILKDKKFQFALKIGWRALAEGEPTKAFSNWRSLSNYVRNFAQSN